jgi:cysteinyl-tRNA synthetase
VAAATLQRQEDSAELRRFCCYNPCVQPNDPSSGQPAQGADQPAHSTGLFLYNSLTRAREELVTREPGKVSLYVCGVTPYDVLHIGHARAFVVYDALRRTLESRGLEVTHVQNVTDVDDKIINAAAKAGTTAQELADRFSSEALVELKQLNVLPAHEYPRVTGHIQPIISMVQVLESKGFAYAGGGDVYFDVSKDKRYGTLSGQKPEELEAGKRIEPGESKDDPLDFALWKSAKPGEPSWESPWGPGRPGWHIECSAMALEILGPAFDIHGGARELIFPHHENERAQSESYLAGEEQNTFAKTWWHCGVVMVDGAKMSKSLGNFLSVAEALKIADRNEWRLFFLTTHPTSPLDYTPERLGQAQNAWSRLFSTLAQAAQTPEKSEAASHFEEKFHGALSDNLSTPSALAAVFDAVSQSNRESDASLAWAAREALQVLGFTFEARAQSDLGELAPALIELLIEVRNAARERRDFKASDQVRAKLSELKIVLEDTPEGTRWKIER